MLLDGLLNFVPPSAPLSLVGGAGVSFRSGIIDLLGLGVGVAPQSIIGTRTLFGADMGIDDQKLQLLCTTGTAFATANAATLNVQFQAAVDTGVGGGYQPGTWNTFLESGAIAVANLGAAKTIARFDYPPAFPATLSPRFISLNFNIPSGTNFMAGTIAFAMLTAIRDDIVFGAKNFTVA